MEEISEKLWLCPLPHMFPSFLWFPRREETGKESMATRTQRRVSKRPKGDTLEKQKAHAANAAVKSRSALNDIGNINSRPFGGKTLASASTEAQPAVTTSNKLSVILQSNTEATSTVLGLRPLGRKKNQRVPKQNEVVNLLPQPGDMTKKICVSDSKALKLVPSISSVLLVNGKVASNINENPTPQIDEIDLPDVNNPQAVTEYVHDLYAFYNEQQHLHRPIDYMDKQLDINSHMREVLVDWIIEVHYEYKLLPETLYLTINLVDRYFSLNIVARRNLQLVGLCTMLIACKYEEVRSSQVDDLIHLVLNYNRYKREEILEMEQLILNQLGWYLTVPTNYMFLVRYVKVAKADQEMEHMIYFFSELGLMQYDLVQYCPSMLAASAVYTARCALQKFPLWTDALEHHTSYSESQLLECARALVKAHCSAPDNESNVVYRKYMLEEFGGVARYQPAVSLIEASKSDASCDSS